MIQVAVTKTIEIAAAHHQPGYPGKCARNHGHNYVVSVTAVGDPDGLDQYGMLIDFGTMKRDLEAVVGIHDHGDLNDTYETPSIETIAIDWLTSLHRINPSYVSLTVHENERSSCHVDWMDD